MATVTVHWRTGNSTSFETFDRATITRYRRYGHTDPGIKRVKVTGPVPLGIVADESPDDNDD